MHFTDDLISEGKAIAATCITSRDHRDARDKGCDFGQKKLAEMEVWARAQRSSVINAQKDLVFELARYTRQIDLGGLAADAREAVFFGMVVDVLTP